MLETCKQNTDHLIKKKKKKTSIVPLVVKYSTGTSEHDWMALTKLNCDLLTNVLMSSSGQAKSISLIAGPVSVVNL